MTIIRNYGQTTSRYWNYEESVQIEEGVECETFSIGGGPAWSTVLSASHQFGNSCTMIQIVSVVGGYGEVIS